MIEDQIALSLKALKKLKEELKGLKKDMKSEEKVDTKEYEELKKSYKDLKWQVRDLEEQWTLELQKDQTYNQLRELKVKKDEELAKATEKLFDQVAKLPAKAHQWNVELDEGPVKIQIQPEMRVYINGIEEKRRVAL